MNNINFEKNPSNYLHWKLKVDENIAYLFMDVQED